jgi:hypothetical protein
MVTLHIEHPITDFDVWKAAFDAFAAQRDSAGVQGHRILRPAGEASYVVVELDFQTRQQAEQFLRFLQTSVWASAATAPALAGTPQTTILEPAVHQ